MLWNYIKIALRNLSRQKEYTLINLAGMSSGMAACILIMLLVIHELSYDRFHHGVEDIYRVAIDGQFGDDILNIPLTNAPLCHAMIEDLPEVVSATRIENNDETALFSQGGHHFYEEGLLMVDSTFFDVFSFNILQGNPHTALTTPYSIMLTQSAARKYFGTENPMGQTLRMNNQYSFKVTGILADVPDNSHIQFTMLASFSTLYAQGKKEHYNDWGSFMLYTYVRLVPGSNIKETEAQFPALFEKHLGDLSSITNIKIRPYLQPLTNIHLHSHLIGELTPSGDIAHVYAFTAIALFILLIACINYMNLSTAQAVKRSREIGIRKVLGADRHALIRQFLGETVLFTLIAIILGLLFTELTLPLFNQITNVKLSLQNLTPQQWIVMLMGLALFTGIFAGSYPAFFLSSLQPVQVLKGAISSSRRKPTARNILVVFQFTVSIVLIISTTVIYQQLDFLQNKKLGFEKEHLLIIPLRGDELQKKHQRLISHFNTLTVVEQASISNSIPGKGLDGTGFVPEGTDPNKPFIIYTLYGNKNLIHTMGMKLFQGRPFYAEASSDSLSVIINETMAKKLGWRNPLGKKIFFFGDTEQRTSLTVIGVIKDFYFKSLHEPCEPSMISSIPLKPNFLLLRLIPGDLATQLNSVKNHWNTIAPEFPFDYIIPQDTLNTLHHNEQQMGRLFVFFTILAIIIACLGLLGLVSYTAGLRAREIGIRKVLGASILSIINMLAFEFIRWILLGTLLAWPLAYYIMQQWLNNFAFHIQLNAFVFVLAAGAALIIALLTILWQAIKIALTNPIEVINYE